MSLRAIVRAVGGDLYDGGTRANIPAPGHSPRDRSVSLLWSGGRIVVYSFGGADWRDVLDDLHSKGLLPGAIAPGGPPPRAAPTAGVRIAVARRLWEATRPLEGALGERHLRLRHIRRPLPGDLRFHRDAPVSVYADRSATRPALVAAVRDAAGELTAVELSYLDASGHRTTALRLSRKTVGAAPAGSAVRLDAAAAQMLVAEGVATALSASERFGLPAWALLSAHNLARWSPPALVRHVLVAGDRGAVGEASAARLARRLGGCGVAVTVALPPEGFGDWNEASAGGRGRAGGGAP